MPLLFAAALVPPPADGQAAAPPAPAASDSLDDGPHVYWPDDRHAIVFYLCRASVAAQRFEVRDTLAFRGLCADSATTYHLASRPPRPPRDTWDGVPRILAISDVHGEYDALVAFLEAAGVIDAAGRWNWGDGHLVVVGDVVDRGARVTECLWFLHRLEREAEQAGGRVHVLLGNHEMMVMRDDVRYVHDRYTNGIVRHLGVRYADLFGPAMELGRWLRSKPFVLRLNDVVFVHGGISPEVAGKALDLRTLNTVGRESLDLSSVALVFSDLPALLLRSGGPLWYRGYFQDGGTGDSASTDELRALLSFYGASAVVVGHTPMGGVNRFHEGRVFAIEPSARRRGAIEGLLWENGSFSVVRASGAVEPFE